jgi:transcription elongation factor Elf1
MSIRHIRRNKKGEKSMLIMTFPCPKCDKPMGFDYADYDLKDAVDSEKSTYFYEELECKGCGKKLKTVPWIAVYDEK